MKLSGNVEIETSEVKPSSSRTSRMARYPAAAAGVAAVSSIEVDTAMIKAMVTNAQNKTNYTLDLSEIVSGASTELTLSNGGDLYLALPVARYTLEPANYILVRLSDRPFFVRDLHSTIRVKFVSHGPTHNIV